MTIHFTDPPQGKVVKLAGFMFLFAFIVPTLNWAFILSKFIVAENVITTAKNILANEFLFRLGIAIELIMSIGLILLAYLLYIILKQVNKRLALFALLLKLAEATISVVIVLITFIVLQFLNEGESSSSFTPEQILTPLGIILSSHTALYSIPMLFLGLDMMLFSYLFLKSKFIPRTLASLGILSFGLIFIHSLMFILAPAFASTPLIQIIFWTPSGLFEIIIGIMLLVKGLNIQQTITKEAK